MDKGYLSLKLLNSSMNQGNSLLNSCFVQHMPGIEIIKAVDDKVSCTNKITAVLRGNFFFNGGDVYCRINIPGTLGG